MKKPAKPSLSEYSDTLTRFTHLADNVRTADNMPPEYVAIMDTISSDIAQAHKRATLSRQTHLSAKTPGYGTDKWQADNAGPFVNAMAQVNALLNDDGFIDAIASTSKPQVKGQIPYSGEAVAQEAKFLKSSAQEVLT